MAANKVPQFTIHKENPTRSNNVPKLTIPYLYEAQHVSGDKTPIIRSLKLHWQPLVFHTWKVVGRVAGGCYPPATCPTTFHIWKTRGCQCSFRLLMMGGVLPKTCWASYTYGIINFDTLLHLVGFSLWIVLWCTDPKTSKCLSLRLWHKHTLILKNSVQNTEDHGRCTWVLKPLYF